MQKIASHNMVSLSRRLAPRPCAAYPVDPTPRQVRPRSNPPRVAPSLPTCFASWLVPPRRPGPCIARSSCGCMWSTQNLRLGPPGHRPRLRQLAAGRHSRLGRKARPRADSTAPMKSRRLPPRQRGRQSSRACTRWCAPSGRSGCRGFAARNAAGQQQAGD